MGLGWGGGGSAGAVDAPVLGAGAAGLLQARAELLPRAVPPHAEIPWRDTEPGGDFARVCPVELCLNERGVLLLHGGEEEPEACAERGLFLGCHHGLRVLLREPLKSAGGRIMAAVRVGDGVTEDAV